MRPVAPTACTAVSRLFPKVEHELSTTCSSPAASGGTSRPMTDTDLRTWRKARVCFLLKPQRLVHHDVHRVCHQPVPVRSRELRQLNAPAVRRDDEPFGPHPHLVSVAVGATAGKRHVRRACLEQLLVGKDERRCRLVEEHRVVPESIQ